MTRIIGIHEVQLKPGVDGAAFEKAMDTVMKVPLYPGWRVSLLKSDRGSRSGKYGVLFEIDSMEARNRIINDSGETEECKKFDADHPKLVAAWQHVQSLIAEPSSWSDYLVTSASR